MYFCCMPGQWGLFYRNPPWPWAHLQRVARQRAAPAATELTSCSQENITRLHRVIFLLPPNHFRLIYFASSMWYVFKSVSAVTWSQIIFNPVSQSTLVRPVSSNKFLLSFYFRHPSLVTPFDAMISTSVSQAAGTSSVCNSKERGHACLFFCNILQCWKDQGEKEICPLAYWGITRVRRWEEISF